MILYISGPMTGIKDKNFPAFEDATMHLRNAGYQVVSPHELESELVRFTWEDCLRRDIQAEMACHSIATLPGWKKSKGAKLEVYIAQALGYEVHTINYWLKEARNAVY